MEDSRKEKRICRRLPGIAGIPEEWKSEKVACPMFGRTASNVENPPIMEEQMAPMGDNTILKYLYNNRKEFNIVAITGPTGCGFEDFTKIISEPFALWENQVRKLDDVRVNEYDEDNDEEIPHNIIKQTVFKRKYTICYNYWKKHQFSHFVLKYNKVALLYALSWIMEQNTARKENYCETIKMHLFEVLNETRFGKKYCEELQDDNLFKKIFSNIFENIREIDYSKLWDELSSLSDITQPFNIQDDEKRKVISKYFLEEDSEYTKFYEKFSEKLKKQDFFAYCYLWHRLGTNIRTYGTPIKSSSENKQEHLFDLIELINIIIKEAPHEKERRFCIDSIRNSLEAHYLKERYSAFYLIALYNSGDFNESILKLVNKHNGGFSVDVISKYIKELSRTEGDLGDYKKGKFSSPDVEQCVAQAEIHIICQNHKDETLNLPEFYSTAEQWMKFASLMLHPGLITPSSDERCMEIAYTAKFNSGCVSRQVGAVITNAEHAIRTIGWNEVPYGQVSCGLRSISDIVRNDFSEYKHFMYSDFERGVSNQTDIYRDGESFQKKMQNDYGSIIDQMENNMDTPPVFCFREMHNKYTGERNQVYGRSLHAEENAMMQITRSGGEGLHDGIIFVTASPCELCSRKLYQIGVRKIVYIDPYPGIAREQTIASGYKKPMLVQYRGAYGATYYKLYTPLIAPKDEQTIRCENLQCGILKRQDIMKLVQEFMKDQGVSIDITKSTFSLKERETLKEYLDSLKVALNEPNNNNIREITIQVLMIILKQ